MKCKGCGAELPYDAYGNIQCQFCNAQNYVPEGKKEVVVKEVEKKGSSKGWLVFILIIVIGFTIAFSGSQQSSTPKPTTTTTAPVYDEAITYNNRGVAYGKSGEYSNAISEFSKAIEINPKYADIYFNRGLAYRELEEYSKAISDYTKAIEINPSWAMPYYNRGLAYRSLGESEKAQLDFDKAGMLDPQYKK
ncbi:MAG: tetratricopeptide repeat protein [Candidatus Hydrothermarchaeales archaeon]